MIKRGLTREDAARLLVDESAASTLFSAGSALTVADHDDSGLYEYTYGTKVIGIRSDYAYPGSITVPAYTLFIAHWPTSVRT